MLIFSANIDHAPYSTREMSLDNECFHNFPDQRGMSSDLKT